jgi:hypothetical protein
VLRDVERDAVREASPEPTMVPDGQGIESARVRLDDDADAIPANRGKIA